MDFFSEQLVSSDYCNRLRLDLQRADVCRFLVAFISEAGLQAIGRRELVRVLGHEDSFGVSSLTRSSGFKPLLNLYFDIGKETARLKYFMDPMVKGPYREDRIFVFNSKLVYLRLPEQNKSVVYVGSHNWSEPSLGPKGPRSVEASIRFEEACSPEHLTGNGPSIMSQVNRQLLTAFENPICLAATRQNEKTFNEWLKSKSKDPPVPLQKATIILAVQKTPAFLGTDHWINSLNRGIYFQALDDGEGGLVLDSMERVLVMLWESSADLKDGIPPVLLRCVATTWNAGPHSKHHGTNPTHDAVAKFGAVIYDEAQLRRTQGRWVGTRSSLEIWSGREVQFFDFEFRDSQVDSSQIDGDVRPNHQFFLRVDQVVFPADRAPSDATDLLWTPESFAVAKSMTEAVFKQESGYSVPHKLRGEILNYLKTTLHVDTDHATKLPVEEHDQVKSGRRISDNPLHETFINQHIREKREEFYGKTKPGWLVAEVDRPSQKQLLLGVMERVQRVLVNKLDLLEKMWTSIAKDVRASKQK